MTLITSWAWAKVNGAWVKEIEAVYEAYVLRPAEPLPFAEKQRVRGTVSDEPVLRDYNPRTQEFEWLRTHRDQYAGIWVALEGDQLATASRCRCKPSASKHIRLCTFFEDQGIAKNVLGRSGWLDRVIIAIADHDQTLYLSPHADSAIV